LKLFYLAALEWRPRIALAPAWMAGPRPAMTDGPSCEGLSPDEATIPSLPGPSAVQYFFRFVARLVASIHAQTAVEGMIVPGPKLDKGNF